MNKKKAKGNAELCKAFKRVFEDEDGQWVLHHLMQFTKFLDVNFATDPTEISFANGQRNVVAYILKTLESDPVKILENARRQKEREKQYDEFNFDN